MTLIALTCFLSANEVPGDRAFKISQTIAHLMRLGDYIRKNAHFRFYHRIIEKKRKHPKIVEKSLIRWAILDFLMKILIIKY